MNKNSADVFYSDNASLLVEYVFEGTIFIQISKNTRSACFSIHLENVVYKKIIVNNLMKKVEENYLLEVLTKTWDSSIVIDYDATNL